MNHTLTAAPKHEAGIPPLDDPHWMAEGPGKWSLPLGFLPDGAGWVELMRLDPGVKLGLHRHTGAVHAVNLQGWRRLHTGRRVGPHEYVYEPHGNVDWWQSDEAGPLVLWVAVMGTVEYLGAGGAVLATITRADREAAYRRHCAERGLQARTLV